MGVQFWTAQNVALRHYRNGDPITHAFDDSVWNYCNENRIGAWSAYKHDTSGVVTYGLLYNWYAVADTRGFAPKGWRVPVDADFKLLEAAVADSLNAGYKLKSKTSWGIEGRGSNQYGFDALGAGLRRPEGKFDSRGTYGDWWTLTEDSTDRGKAFVWGLGSYYSTLYRAPTEKSYGLSVRLIKTSK